MYFNMMLVCCAAGSTKGQSSNLTSVESTLSFQGPSQASDWIISQDSLAVIQGRDGNDCVLGQGSFGKIQVLWPTESMPVQEVHCNMCCLPMALITLACTPACQASIGMQCKPNTL